MWRIAQEAITNVERHARATQITITWRCDGTEGRAGGGRRRHRLPGGPRRPPRLLRPDGHARTSRQHRRHPRRRLRAWPGHAGTLHPRRPLSELGPTWRLHRDDPRPAGRRPPDAARRAAPVAHGGGVRDRRRGRERRAGRADGRRARARRRADGRVDAGDGRRRGHPPHRRLGHEHPGDHAHHARRPGGARRRHPRRRLRLPGQGLLHRGDRRRHPDGAAGRHRPVTPAGGDDARRGPPPRRARTPPKRTGSSPSGRRRCSS